MAPSPPHHSSSSLSKRTLTLARIRKKTKKPSSSPQLPCTGCSSCCWSIDTVQTKGLRASYSCECRGSEPNKQNTQTQRRTGISVRACDGGIQTAKNPPFPSLERADSGARRRGRKLKGVSIVSVNILMTQALPTVCTAPSLVQTACSALIIWLSIQREDSRRLVLLPFFFFQRDNTDGQPGR